MTYNKPKYLVLVQPTSETKWSLWTQKPQFIQQNYKKMLVYEILQPEDPVYENFDKIFVKF
jgi:hypothetical protein